MVHAPPDGSHYIFSSGTRQLGMDLIHRSAKLQIADSLFLADADFLSPKYNSLIFADRAEGCLGHWRLKLLTGRR